MTIQFSVQVRNASLDAVESAVGPGPVLRLWTGPQPINCAAPDSGTLLAVLTLPANWMAPAAGGLKVKAGIWFDAGANASGAPGHFRIYDAGSSRCHMQGTVSAPGQGGDLILEGGTVTEKRMVNITAFTLTAGNP